MCYTEVKRYQDPITGKRRVIEQLRLCGRHVGKTPCSTHQVYDNGQYLLVPEPAATPGSPAGSLLQDGYPSPASVNYPPTPPAHIEERAPSNLGRSNSTKLPKSSKRYSMGDKEVIISRTGDKKRERKYLRRKSVSERHSSDDVVIVAVGGPPIIEAPMPPPATHYQSNRHQHSVPPPPPPPPAPPGIAPTGPSPPTAVPDSPTENRRRRLRPIVTGGFQPTPPPTVPPYTAPFSRPRHQSFREVQPNDAYDEANDNEFTLRQDAREQLRREAKRRQEEADRLLAEQIAQKEKKEAGEEYLATLEMNRFAERDKARAESNAKRERAERELRELREREQEEEERRQRRQLRELQKQEKEEERRRQQLRNLERQDEEQRLRQREREEQEAECRRRKAQDELEAEEETRRIRRERQAWEDEQDRKRRVAERQKIEDELAATTRRLEETKLRQAEERQEAELRQARERAAKLEREVREAALQPEPIDRERERRRAEVKRKEQEVRFLERDIISTPIVSYEDEWSQPSFSASNLNYIYGPPLNNNRYITAPVQSPQRQITDMVQVPRRALPLADETWRERGNRILAEAQAQEASRELNEVIVAGPRGKDGARYYYDGGVKRYY